jgi:hypothetical protein
MAKRAFAYSITIAQVGPVHDPDYVSAPKSVKDEVRSWIVVYGLKEKDHDLAEGLDRYGRPLRPISPLTKKYRKSAMGPADPNAPPLTPAYAVSRTRLLLEGESTQAGAQFWWGYDAHTGGDWGEILDHHRKGIGSRKVKRDVIGLSSAARARVKQQVMARWLAWKRAGLRPGWKPSAPAASVPKPRLVKVRGAKTDYQNFTYGIGNGTGAPAEGVRSTGFFQWRPGTGGTAYGGPETRRRGGPFQPEPPVPTERPRPKPKSRPAPASPPRSPAPTPTPGSAPSTSAIGQHLDVRIPAGSRIGDKVRLALDAIEGLHVVESDQRIPLVSMKTSTNFGEYEYWRGGAASRIRIHENGTHPALTTAHELGHFVEGTMIPGNGKNDRRFGTDPTLSEWLGTVRASRAHGELAALPRRQYVNYLLSEQELWARSYAQWVATRSRDPQLLADLERINSQDKRGAAPPRQWTDEDFEPIAAAIDRLFTSLGWLR